ncbi:MAG: pseudouridine synthase [Candidatus Sericytochromatia bacterium]|nr:pseudouridine synthase [Candidatus Sericytochromatia bacterium]
MIVLLHKPYGTLCQFSPEGTRQTLADVLDIPGIYPAGRLDHDSEGLLVLTDEPWFAHRLTHPDHGHAKVYHAQVEGMPGPDAVSAFSRGILLQERLTRPAGLKHLEPPPDWPERTVPIRFRKSIPTAWVEVILREGRNRQVRKMLAAVGHPCLRLIRVEVAGLSLGPLGPGQHRRLDRGEVRALRQRLAE